MRFGASVNADQMSRDIDPSICPSCGEANACGISQGKSECWCFAAVIEQAALDRIPSDRKKLACICAKCAAAAARASSDSA